MTAPWQIAWSRRTLVLVVLAVCVLPNYARMQSATSTPVARPYFTYSPVFPLGTPGPLDGPADIALFDNLRDVVISPGGVMFGVDGHAVRRIAADGAVTTIAGAVTEAGDIDGVGALARFRDPAALAVDSAGVIFVADTGNHTIRRVAVDGTVTTVAGRAGLSGNANGEARLARLSAPNGIIVHPTGAIYFTEQNCVLRRLTPAQVVEPVSGAPGACGTTDGTAAVARLAGPLGLAVDAGGVMYVAENNHTVRRVTADGVVTRLAGTPGVYGTEDGSRDVGRLSFLKDVTVTPTGAVRVIEAFATVSSGGSHAMNVGQAAIRDIAPDGTLTRVRLLGASAWATSGRALAYDAAGLAYWVHDQSYGPGIELMVAQSSGDALVKSGSGTGRLSRVNTVVAADANGIAELALVDNVWSVRRVSFDGTVITPLASLATSTTEGTLQQIVCASSGTVAVVRRRTDPTTEYVSVIQRVSGGAAQTFATIPAGVLGLAPAPGGGFIVLADSAVFEVTAGGGVRLIAGDRQRGHVDGPAASARFNEPQGAVVAPNGDVFVADTRNNVIRRISVDGQVTTVAGTSGTAGWVDGDATTAQFDSPSSLALVSDGSLIIQEWRRSALRRLEASGIVSTVALPTRPLAATVAMVSPTMSGTGDGRIVWAVGHDLWVGAVTQAALLITQPPVAQAVQAGADAVFSLVATGAPSPYVEWQVSADGGGTWATAAPLAPPIGNRSTLTLRAVTAAMHGRQYRARVVDADEVVYSSVATLSVNGIGVDVTALSFLAAAPASGGFTAASQTVTITVPGGGTSWTVTSDQPWMTVTPPSGTGPGVVTVSVTAGSMIDGQTFYGSLRVAAPGLEPVVLPVQIKALRAPSFLREPRDFAIVAGPGSPSFSTRVTGLEYSVRWEQSNDGVLWTPVDTPASYVLGEWWLGGAAIVEGRQYRAVAANAGGSSTSRSVSARRPTMTADQTTVHFRGWRDQSGALRFNNVTTQVRLSEVSWWRTNWSVSSPVPWLVVTPATGTGAGTVTFTLKPELLPAAIDWTTSTVVMATAIFTGSLQTTNVAAATIAVRVTAPADHAGPFGQVDTPVQSSTGVQGSLAITGWVLDDIGVDRVDIYRECFPFDAASTCESVLGRSLVYVGRSTMVPGARPDVEAAYVGWPDASRAGWGFLLLTPMLPHVPGGRLYGGQGPLTIFAIATDVEGTRRLLGRSADPRDPASGLPTYITLANDSIARPFGAIDSPEQGATVSGVLHNFGWVLTPDSNTVADPTDIVMPTDGSGITVFIDGVARGTVAFNYCRGSAGASVASGAFCDDDVASVFGHPTPQPVFTPRFGNPTAHRNLDAGRGAIGLFSIDTTTLSNGLHSISWGVADSAGRTEGLGSRFFTVANPGSSRSGDAPVARRDPAAVRELPTADAGVWSRVGFDLSAPWASLGPDDRGDYHVTVPEAGRLELWLGAPATAAFMEQSGLLAPLPPEATLDGAHFAWAPPAGYIGDYRLIFVRGTERVECVVRIGRVR